MIRLDAATVLLQWATGGMLFCWFTTRRRIVGLGYGWLLRGVYLCFALGALAAGSRFGTVPIREVASAGVAIACVVALAVSIVRRSAGVRGQQEEFDRRSERVAAMTGIDRTVAAPTIGADRRVRSRRQEFPPVLDLVPVVIGTVGLIAAALDAGGNPADGTAFARSSVRRSSAPSPTRCCSATGTSCSPVCRGACSTRWSRALQVALADGD